MAAYASSYIPTTTTTVTRAADVLTVTSPGLDYPVTLFAEFETGVTTADARVFALHTGDTSNRTLIYLGNNVPTLQNRAGGVNQSSIYVGSAAAIGAQIKFAGRVATDNNQAARAGALGVQDTSATNPSAPTVMEFGANGGVSFFGYLRRVAIYSRALTDAELQAVTT